MCVKTERTSQVVNLFFSYDLPIGNLIIVVYLLNLLVTFTTLFLGDSSIN